MGVPAGGARAFLDVPFAEKDEAKALGARWDPSARRWYAPPRSNPGLQRWARQPEIPELLPGEDRRFGSGLFVDLVPASCWFTNVRSCIAQKDWERLRRMMRTRAGDRCEICGREEDREQRRWLEAHERWHYDDRAGVQTLRRLILCCSWCHQATHMGLADVQGHGETARAHLRAVTGMTRGQTQDHIDTAFALWQARSARTWELDLRILTAAGVTLAAPLDHRQRADVAHELVSQYQGTAPRAAVGGLTANEDTSPGETSRPSTTDSAAPPGEEAAPPTPHHRPWWKRPGHAAP
ncbi:hypothetical protein EV383_6250 [Pseudonocardia sediminis]|uniref:DUF5710 domain-containing protein n=1 Tax=Pseudonocardia sediminis TaxID=1397368 RepID=A0A4Q7U7I7_PSEST|nr:DUF5710 domain-containing protein [Pseudonocardia sediminis]RZT75509.1 hypothetical protein EV383_6250 [Pseudonocardia sediminis]